MTATSAASDIRGEVLSWFETDFRDTAKKTTDTKRLENGKVSYTFSAVNNSGYDFERFSFRLRVVNKADGSELGSATINAGEWASGEKKNFKSVLDIPENVRSISFVMATNSVEFELRPLEDGVQPVISLGDAFREIEDALTGADGSGGVFGELFGKGGMPETDVRRAPEVRPAGSGNAGSSNIGKNKGEIDARPVDRSSANQTGAGRQNAGRQQNQGNVRTQPRQDYRTNTQSYKSRKSEKKLNRKRLGKSPWVAICAAVSAFFLLCAGASIGSTDEVLQYLVMGGVSGAVAASLWISNSSRAKRIRAYEARVNKNGNTSLEELSVMLKRPVNKVADDLQKMIADGFFGEAYVDLDNGLLVMTRNGVPIESPEKTAAANKKAKRQAAREKGKVPEDIEDLIIMTDDAEIKSKLKTLRTISKKIDQRVEEQPDQASQVKDFREHFYPEVVRLTDEYNEKIADLGKYNEEKPAPDPDRPVINAEPNYLEKQAAEIKGQLISLIDSVTEASENMLESLHEGELLDISTDIQTLQTTLASKGLLDSDFDL